MFRWFKPHTQALQTEAFGLTFANPLGVVLPGAKIPRSSRFRENPGFLTLTPPQNQVLSWTRSLQKVDRNLILAVDLTSDIVRIFSLVYDFSDLIIIDPDTDGGIGAIDISDTRSLLDELVSLRLCYERYTPVLLRLTHGLTQEELHTLLSACQIGGIDGVVVPAGRMLREAREITLGRLPAVADAEDADQALQALQDGACLVETRALRPVQLQKVLKTLEKQAKNK